MRAERERSLDADFVSPSTCILCTFRSLSRSRRPGARSVAVTQSRFLGIPSDASFSVRGLPGLCRSRGILGQCSCRGVGVGSGGAVLSRAEERSRRGGPAISRRRARILGRQAVANRRGDHTVVSPSLPDPPPRRLGTPARWSPGRRRSGQRNGSSRLVITGYRRFTDIG